MVDIYIHIHYEFGDLSVNRYLLLYRFLDPVQDIPRFKSSFSSSLSLIAQSIWFDLLYVLFSLIIQTVYIIYRVILLISYQYRSSLIKEQFLVSTFNHHVILESSKLFSSSNDNIHSIILSLCTTISLAIYIFWFISSLYLFLHLTIPKWLYNSFKLYMILIFGINFSYRFVLYDYTYEC